MKLFISPDVNIAPHGIKRVLEAMHRYLPEFGIEIVDNEADADVVNVHAAAFVDTMKPVVYSSHGLYWADHEWGDGFKGANQAMIDYMTRAQAITAVSDWVAHAINRGMARKAEVVYHGVDTEQWYPGGEPGGYVLWNKARADQVSNPDDMQRLAASLPDVPFVTTIGQETPNVRVTGPMPHDEMQQYVRGAGLYLATARETMGIGTLEAMACGVPVVGWNWGGQREIFELCDSPNDWPGVLVEPGDYEALTDAVRRVMAARPFYAKNARAQADKHWRWEDKIEDYAVLFFKTLKDWQRDQERPKVSVIVTCYNLARYLPDALESVRAQTLTDWECIVVDDCSTDNTKDVVMSFYDRDRRIFYQNTQQNRGLSGARNFGFEVANGRYILHLDADDVLAPNALEVLSAFLDKYPGLGLAYGHMDILSEDGQRRDRDAHWPFEYFNWFGQIAHLHHLPYCAMMRREVLKSTGGYRVRDWRAEDASFAIRATSLGWRAEKVTQDSVLYWRKRTDSKSASERQTLADGDGDWTSWFPWRLAGSAEEGRAALQSGKRPNPAVVPFGAQGASPDICWPVWSHHDPVVSIIIPVGPGHEHLLVDALDSIQAQTVPFWEAVVVNNTGKPLDVWLPAWARLVECETPGAGAARNAGIDRAKADLLLFLDADDILLPTAVEWFLEAYIEADGSRYIFSDWYGATPGEEPTYHDAKEYQRRSPDGSGHAVTCLVPKAWAIEVGGFHPRIKGWEDWEFYVKLAIAGFCGMRMGKPTFIYRSFTGKRRDDSLKHQGELLTLLRNAYGDYYNGTEVMMPCCGSNPTGILEAKRALGLLDGTTAVEALNGGDAKVGTTRLEYVGTNLGAISISRAGGQKLTRTYRAGRVTTARFHDVDDADVAALLETGRWKKVARPAIDLRQATVPQRPLTTGGFTGLPPANPAVDVVPGLPNEETAVAPPADLDLSGPVPLQDITAMNVTEVKDYILGKSATELSELLEQEKAQPKTRKTVVTAIEALMEIEMRVTE